MDFIKSRCQIVTPLPSPLRLGPSLINSRPQSFLRLLHSTVYTVVFPYSPWFESRFIWRESLYIIIYSDCCVATMAQVLTWPFVADVRIWSLSLPFRLNLNSLLSFSSASWKFYSRKQQLNKCNSKVPFSNGEHNRIYLRNEFEFPHLKYLIHVEESRRVKKKHGGRAEFAFNLCKIKPTFSVIIEKTKPV